MQESMNLESDKYSLNKKVKSEFMFQWAWSHLSL